MIRSALLVAALTTTTVALASGVTYHEGQGLQPISTNPFRLVKENRGAATARTLGRLLRRATPAQIAASPNRTGERVRSVSGVANFHVGFRWNDGDASTGEWYPQGVTGTADATASGEVGGKKLLLVSWYHKPEKGHANKGVRVTFVDATDVDHVRYRHVLLVEPIVKNGRADFRAVPIHAGGITWYGRWLYVADTYSGFRVFDTQQIFHVATGDKDKIGYDPATRRYHAHDYAFAMPQVARWRIPRGAAPAVFSSVSLDRSGTDSLVTCEYHENDITGRVFRWALDARTGDLANVRRTARPKAAFVSCQARVQGALSYGGEYLLSCSGSHPALYATRPGVSSRRFSWAHGTESLTFSPLSGNVWSVTEHPGSRVVFCVKRDDVRR